MKRETSRHKTRSIARFAWLGAAIGVVILVILVFIPMPYYFFSPGEAQPLSPIITVKGGHKMAKGEFMLTSVFVLYTQNIYEFLFGLTIPHHQILSVQDVSAGLPDNEYNAIEAYMMQSSHQNAQIAALRYLHLPVSVKSVGVYVMYVEPNSSAQHLLRDGDIILAINHQSIHDPQQLISALQHDRVGQTVTLTIRRGKQVKTVRVNLTNLTDLPGSHTTRAGIGILPSVAESVSSPYHVSIRTGNLDGPSAGFMFSLEIVNQLYRGGNLTDGYKIAGTGTIDANGTIGQIGGVEHKVVAASVAGAQYFFVPQDTKKGDTNQIHAEQTVKNLHLNIKVIPVHTLAEAVRILKSLPLKTGKPT